MNSKMTSESGKLLGFSLFQGGHPVIEEFPLDTLERHVLLTLSTEKKALSVFAPNEFTVR